jgi:hypothetical protein
MNENDIFAGRQATGLAFETLSKVIRQLFEDRAYEAHPGYGVPGDPHLKAIAQPDREVFEDLAGLAHAGLKIIEGEREWFLTEALRAPGSYDFWYMLALAVNKAATGHMDSSQPASVPVAAIQTLFCSLLRFLPYACVQPGDCALRTADALISLFQAFPSDDMYQQAEAASFTASLSSNLLSAVQDRVRESHRAAHPFKQDESAEE